MQSKQAYYWSRMCHILIYIKLISLGLKQKKAYLESKGFLKHGFTTISLMVDDLVSAHLKWLSWTWQVVTKCTLPCVQWRHIEMLVASFSVNKTYSFASRICTLMDKWCSEMPKTTKKLQVFIQWTWSMTFFTFFQVVIRSSADIYDIFFCYTGTPKIGFLVCMYIHTRYICVNVCVFTKNNDTVWFALGPSCV